MQKLFSNYAIECFLLILALFVFIASLYLDLKFNSDNNWFSRSGSLLVLCSAIVEYRLSLYIFGDIHKINIKNAIKNKAISSSDNQLLQALSNKKAEPSKSRKYLALTSHVLIILGTLTWGYGDLLLP